MDLRRAPPAPSRERKGQKREARPLRCGGVGVGMAGPGGPLGPYFRATPVPRNSKLRLSMRFRFKKGAFWISWDLPWGGLWEVVSISKSQLLMQNSIWPTRTPEL